MSSYQQWDMQEVSKKIGALLRQVRQERGLTLDTLAANIGVSKLTLGQIERGDANPTLAVIWKIANGLSIPVTKLLAVERAISISRRDKGLQLVSPNEAFTVQPIFSDTGQHHFEMFRAYLKPNSEYKSEAHFPGVEEIVTVMSGSLNIQVKGETYELEEYDSIRFQADHIHTYINPTDSLTVLHFVITYSEGQSGTIIFGHSQPN